MKSADHWADFIATCPHTEKARLLLASSIQADALEEALQTITMNLPYPDRAFSELSRLRNELLATTPQNQNCPTCAKPKMSEPSFIPERDPASNYGPIPPDDQTRLRPLAGLPRDIDSEPALAPPDHFPATAPTRILTLTIRTEDGLALSQEVRFSNLASDTQRRAIFDTLNEMDWGLYVAQNARAHTP